MLVLALPSLFYRGGGGKGTERLRNMPKGTQQCLGRAGFRLGQLGPESTCLPTGLTYCLLVLREQRLHGCHNETTCCDRDFCQGRVGSACFLADACLHLPVWASVVPGGLSNPPGGLSAWSEGGRPFTALSGPWSWVGAGHRPICLELDTN